MPGCLAMFGRRNGTGLSGRSEPQSSTINAGNTRRFSPPNTSRGQRADSHGVSDPSGQARGQVGRAQRGRSRHGFIPHSDSGTALGGKKRRPFADRSGSRAWNVLRSNCLQRAVQAPALTLAKGEWTDRHAGRGTTSILEVVPQVVLSPTSFRRRQPGGRDGGTAVRAGCSRRARGHVPERRQSCLSRPSRACWPGLRATDGTALGTSAR